MTQVESLWMKKFIFKTHTSTIKLMFSILSTMLIFDIILFLLFTFVDFLEIKSINIFPFFSNEENMIIIFLLLIFIIFIIMFIRWMCNCYTIKDWNIIHINWVFLKNKQLLIISDINRLEFKQGIVWRMFDYWNIIIWYNDNKVVFKNLQYPEEFINNIEVMKSYSGNSENKNNTI